MKLRDLKKIINMCVKEAGKTDPDVYLYYGNSTELQIVEVNQFSVVPDVTIKFKKVKYDH